jgi:hypothetical protein
MGTMIFDLPTDLPDVARDELERASIAGGQDGMPYPTEATVEHGKLVAARRVDESGSLLAPWDVGGAGRLMVASATLMERRLPYNLPIELARGKVNQVRSQASDWLLGGLVMPPELDRRIAHATHLFGRAIAALPDPEGLRLAGEALAEAYQAGHELVRAYIDQVFQVRHQRQAQLDTLLGCRLQSSVPATENEPAFLEAFNAVVVPFAWSTIEPQPGQFAWDVYDRQVEWATRHGLRLIGGPLIDFSGRSLPDWFWERETDLLSIGGMFSDFVERVVGRYCTRVPTWQVSAGSNHAGVLATRDDELLWLTIRLVEAVRRVGPQLETIVGLAHPWGDYLTEQTRNHSPFMFADTLLRTGLKVSGLDLEVIMGVGPRGSYCRDTLDLSRILDLYALLGAPLHVTLGYPSACDKIAQADPDQRVNLGHWRAGCTVDTQADWAASFAALTVCKPYVRAATWCHLSDAEPHQFPHAGLVDADGRVKPAFQELALLRRRHLK